MVGTYCDSSVNFLSEITNNRFFESLFDFFIVKSTRVQRSILALIYRMVERSNPRVIVGLIEADDNLLIFLFDVMAKEHMTDHTQLAVEILYGLLEKDREYSQLSGTAYLSRKSAIKDFIRLQEPSQVLESLMDHYNKNITDLVFNLVSEFLEAFSE